MASRSGISRDRLTRRGVGGPAGPLGGFLVAVLVVLVVIGGGWFLFLRGDPEPVASVVTTTSTTEPVATETTESGGEKTSTTEGSTTQTTLVGDIVEAIPVMTEEEAYLGAQAKLVWLPGTQTGWIVDMASGTVGRFLDVPGGRRGEGAPVRDGSLLIEIEGRIMRRTPSGEWLDLSPRPDRAYRIVDTRTGTDHLHIYAIESNGAGSDDRLLNLMLQYDTPEALDEKWVADGSDLVRVSASKAAQLVILELAPLEAGGPPEYLLLSESSGRGTNRGRFPTSEPPEIYVWALEFLEGDEIFYMRCTDQESFSACGVSEGEIVDLSSGAITPVSERYPGWSLEWERVGSVPSIAFLYSDSTLLLRANVDLADAVTGDRDRLIGARDY